MLHNVNFKAEFNRFEFRVFLLQDQLPKQGKRALTVILVAGGRINRFSKENSIIIIELLRRLR